MDYFIKQRLNNIEQMTRQIISEIKEIHGYCDGMETVARNYTPQTYPYPNNLLFTNYERNGYQEIISTDNLIKEIKEMMIELTIKGSVRERSNGLIELRTQALGSIYGRSKDEIEQKLTQKLKEAKARCKKANPKLKAPLLSEFFNTEYLPYKQNQQRSAKTIKGYHDSLGYIKRENFDKPLGNYKAKEIEDFLYSIPHSRTRQILQGFLNNIFERAVMLNLIKSNPCASMEKVQHSQEQGTAFSFDEQKEFFENLSANQWLNYNQKCYFIFVYLIGARRMEAINLTIEDVDFKNKTLHIRGTKTGGSNRLIPLTPLVEKLLLSLGVTKGKYFDITDYTSDKYFRRIWSKKKKHKLHDLRHTFGTIQICVEKIDVKTVSLWLGHSTVNTTLATYTHPEQLDRGTFLRGDLSVEEKLSIYKSKYREIISQVEAFIL